MGICLLGLSSVAQAGEKIHIVFDLDWTLIRSLKALETRNIPIDAGQIVTFEGEKYLVTEGASDLVSNLSDHTNISISFYSGGEKARNLAILKQLKLPDGRSFFNLFQKIIILSKKQYATA